MSSVLTDDGDSAESDEESKFMQKLEYLRTQAEVFLKMLNDMRRRLKELSPESPAAQQYRCVIISWQHTIICFHTQSHYSSIIIILLIKNKPLQECNERCYSASLPFKQKTIQCSNASRWDDTFRLVREDTKSLSKISGILNTLIKVYKLIQFISGNDPKAYQDHK